MKKNVTVDIAISQIRHATFGTSHQGPLGWEVGVVLGTRPNVGQV